MMRKLNHNDSIGRPINVGDVVTHATKHSTSIGFGVGVVRELHDDGSFSWARVSEVSEYYKDDQGWHVKHHNVLRRSRIYNHHYCTIIAMSEAELKAKFDIKD